MTQRLVILLWHRVLPQRDPLRPYDPDAAEFARCVAMLRRWFNVLSLGEGLARLRARELPARALCITFDDGYADNLNVALPILQRHGLPAAVFVATGYLNGGCMWNDALIEVTRRCPHASLDARSIGCEIYDVNGDAARLAAADQLIRALKYRPHEERRAAVDRLAAELGVGVPRDLMLDDEGVRALARAGVEVGGHSHSHPILAQLDAAAAASELGENTRRLTSLLGAAPQFFAYPNGRPGRDYGAREVELVKNNGYGAALSTRVGAATVNDDVYELPRFSPWMEPSVKLVARLLKLSYLG